MKIRKLPITLIFLLLSINVIAQDKENFLSMAKEKILRFYNILYDKGGEEFSTFYCGPGEIKNEELKKYYTELTFNITYDSLSKVINKLIIQDEGLGFSEYAILNFGDDKKLYFLISLDDAYVGRIWLSNGEELYPKLKYEDTSVESLLWIGIINKNEGNIKIYEQPCMNSKVIKILLPNEVFKYCPIGKNWWPVYENGVTLLGYIQKKDVIMYKDFPKELKAKVKSKC